MTLLPAELSLTVYSVVWPQTEALMRQCLVEEADSMLSRHRLASTKRQDSMHADFFDAWRGFAAPAVQGLEQFSEAYPCAGSSEAIREIIRQAAPRGQSLVVFDGDYEGYDILATQQSTPVLRVDRATWRQTLDLWRTRGVPWGTGGAQWWISQPSAVDGNVWPDFSEWLDQVAALPGVQVWVDLCYVGSARQSAPIVLPPHPALAGVVFSLSKVMGAYYRRIGGCLSRAEVPGLWGNRWFKNLDSLYLGRRWLEAMGTAPQAAAAAHRYQSPAMARALAALGGEDLWSAGQIQWRASEVPLLIHAAPTGSPPAVHADLWNAALRGQVRSAAARLCITPAIETILLEEATHVA